MGSCNSVDQTAVDQRAVNPMVVVGYTEKKAVIRLPDGSEREEIVGSEKKTLNQSTMEVTIETMTVLPDGTKMVSTCTRAPTTDEVLKVVSAAVMVAGLLGY